MSYHLRAALVAMRSNLTATLATLSTMVLTLVLLAFVSLVTLNLERTLRSIESEVEVQAFLTPSPNDAERSAKAERVLGALQDTKRFPEVASVRNVPRERAYAELALDYPYLNDAARLVNNPLPDAVRVKLVSANNVRAVAERVRALADVADVEYGAGFVENVVTAIGAVRAGGYGLVVLLVLNSLFNILNTIRVAMYARRDEINVMRLIGATRGFIRAPYVLEGVGLGLLAGLLTAAIVFPTYRTGAERVRALAPFLPITTDPAAVLQVLAALVGLGMVIGLLGSFVAANRYLQEAE